MGRVTFRGADDIIYYDSAFSSPWGLLTSGLTSPVWENSVVLIQSHLIQAAFFEFPRSCGTHMQDVAREWVAALKMLNGLTAMRHDKCCNCVIAAVTPPLLINPGLASVSSRQGSGAPLRNVIDVMEANSSEDSRRSHFPSLALRN